MEEVHGNHLIISVQTSDFKNQQIRHPKLDDTEIGRPDHSNTWHLAIVNSSLPFLGLGWP